MRAPSAGQRGPRHDRPADSEPVDWPRALAASGAERDAALLALHALLLRVSRADALRRSERFGIAGQELEDVAQQAADDALVAVVAVVSSFRGDSKFTTWAYRFAVLEVGVKINRHHWRREGTVLDEASWERLPAHFGMEPERQSEWRELMDAVRRAVEAELTDRQRRVFTALVVNGMPLDALVDELGSSRNAVYKVMFDARRKIYRSLVEDGLVQAVRA